MRPDPKIRKDGTCFVCRKPIETKARSGLPFELYLDPFCSTLCAKAYHDLDVELQHAGGRAPGYVSRKR